MVYQVIQFLHDISLRAVDIYRMLILVYFLMSWIPGAYQSSIGRILIRICEPYVGFFRRFVPPIGMFSLAGIVALFALSFIRMGITPVFQIILNLFNQIGLV
ncbi:YggT family protein [Marinilactibacillus sp. XAAS-LB27]|uniref:YggT family protein n=1 Tax=Marinilactibacillus sp. XAAS-LB27 TaxID=3114538 RepID=UPI002E1730C5|nr:YggT family protein [Marinilactibacillus sp. XAAS-LB27]